jgi:hypothetical protein
MATLKVCKDSLAVILLLLLALPVQGTAVVRQRPSRIAEHRAEDHNYDNREVHQWT